MKLIFDVFKNPTKYKILKQVYSAIVEYILNRAHMSGDVKSTSLKYFPR